MSVPVSSVTFDAAASTLVENGYQPIPVTFCKKGGGLPAWQNYRFTPGDENRFAGWGVGILAKHTPAVDIDVRDEAIVAELDALLAASMRWLDGYASLFKFTPLRIGAAPKMIRLFQVDGTPFEKLCTREFVLLGDDTTAPGYRPHKVEILSDGQQFAAFNQHPTTGRPYTWNDTTPLNTHRNLLPLLSRADAAHLIQKFDEVLLKYGMPYTPDETLHLDAAPVVGTLVQNAKRLEARDTWNNERDKLKSALASINPDMPRKDWINIIAAIALGSDGSEDGFEFAHAWSRGDFQGVPAALYADESDCLKVFKSFKHKTGSKLTTFRTIFATAIAAGWKQQSVPPRPLATVGEAEPLPQARHLATDQRNVDRIIAAYGRRLLSVGGKLYAWSGTHWELDTGLARRFAGNLSRIVFEEYERAEAESIELSKSDQPHGDRGMMLEAVKDSLLKWGPKCEMAATQNAALKMLVEAVKIDADQLDANPLLLNLENGTFNIETGQLQPHDPLDYITKLAPVEYDPAATCPRFDQFLNEVFDSDLVGDFAMRWFGYCSTGETKEQFVVIHWGQGANGKGTLIKNIAAMMGDYAGTGAPGLLTAKNEDQRHPAEIADLFGKRMVTCSESDEGATLREGFVKQASGEDKMKGRVMHGQFFEFFPTHKLQLQTNKKPVVKGTDHGIWRRLLMLPYLNRFGTPADIAAGKANKPRDNGLDATLKAEWSGILNRIINGARAWHSDGLAPPAIVLEASERYRQDQDRIGEYVRDELTLDINGRAVTSDLYGHYQHWEGSSGNKGVPQAKFLAELEKLVPGFARLKSNGKRYIVGVTIGQQPQ